MKKLKNNVFLETVHFPLSDEDIELLDLELNEIKESENKGKSVFKCRINAIHAGTTRNFHTYPLEELEASVKKWTKPYGKPVLRNHDIYEEPLGRVVEASMIKYSNSDGVLSLVTSIPDEDAAEKIRDQRYVTVSVGVTSRKVECSICGTNWFEDECDHDVGKEYEGGVCTANIRDIQPIELSFVNLPADANDERFAGVVAIGESEDFEFFSGEGKGVAKSKKKSSDDDIALALKETWNDFLSLLNTEGEETQTMDEETQTQEINSEEEINAEDTVTNEEQTLDVEDTQVSEETTDGESTEEETTSDEITNETESNSIVDELSSLSEYFSDTEENEDASDETDNIEETVDEDITTLQNKITELEEDNSRLKHLLAEQDNAVSEIAKNVRTALARHIADLKVILNKADINDSEIVSQSTIKELVIELKELRKEFKESDLTQNSTDSFGKFLENETLVNTATEDDELEDKVSEASATNDTQAFSMSESEVIAAMTKRLSQGRPDKRKGQ